MTTMECLDFYVLDHKVYKGAAAGTLSTGCLKGPWSVELWGQWKAKSSHQVLTEQGVNTGL